MYRYRLALMVILIFTATLMSACTGNAAAGMDAKQKIGSHVEDAKQEADSKVEGVKQEKKAEGVKDDQGASTEKSDQTNNDLGASTEEIKQSDKVVTLVDQTFDQEDLSFYTLMEKVKIELNRAEDQANLDGEALKDKNKYWDEQLRYYENINVQLQSLIEINAMALLAEEKNYFIPEDKLRKATSEWEAKVSENKVVEQMILEFGEKEYNRFIREYLRVTMLRDRVAHDLEDELIKENPKASEEEINYMLEQNYEELYMDQLESLDLEIHVK